MKAFDKTYKQMMQDISNGILLESYDSLYEPVIAESLLECPTSIFNEVKAAVRRLMDRNDFDSVIKIGILDVINDDYCKNLDVEIYDILLKLFKDNSDSYFEVKLGDSSNSFNFSQECGAFEMPPLFRQLESNRMKESHLNIPRIEPLKLDNILVNSFCDKFNKEIKRSVSKFKENEALIRSFKDIVLASCDKNFGRIVIYPEYCGDESDLNKVTLDEAIKHECQHLCVFLMSIAKTCIWVGVHFSNSLAFGQDQYELRENEFIQLFSTYVSVLKRIYHSIDEPKSMNDFIRALLSLCLRNVDDDKYSKAIKSSQLFLPIKNFYLKIYKDSYYRRYDNEILDGKFVKRVATKFLNDNKFDKLMKWTYKALSEYE